MSTRSFLIPENLDPYIRDHWVREPEILVRLREETSALPEANMQIAADQGQLFRVLIRALQVRNALEIGVFTGYSSLVTAMALPEDGHLVALDVSEEYTAIARRYWREAGVEHKIDLRIAPAVESLTRLQDEGRQFDFCFIDADKPNYWAYFEATLGLVKTNGLIAVDNVLWSGKVADPAEMEESTVALREFNRRVHGDPRVDVCLVPIGDGLTLARVR